MASAPNCESTRYDPLANMMPLSCRRRAGSNRCRIRIGRKLMNLVLADKGPSPARARNSVRRNGTF